MRVAFFGGTFDPPHIGHVEIVKEIEKHLYVERIFVTPAYINPFKSNFVAPPDLRLSWLKKLFSCCKFITILDYETRQKKPTPTIETIKYIKKCYKTEKIYLIIGADNLEKFHLWHKHEELTKLVEVVAVTRNDIFIPKNLKKLVINVNISSLNLRTNFNDKYIPNAIKNQVQTYYQGK